MDQIKTNEGHKWCRETESPFVEEDSVPAKEVGKLASKMDVFICDVIHNIAPVNNTKLFIRPIKEKLADNQCIMCQPPRNASQLA